MQKAGTNTAAAPRSNRPATATTRPDASTGMTGLTRKPTGSASGAEVAALNEKLAVMEKNNKTLEVEREFYFNKL